MAISQQNDPICDNNCEECQKLDTCNHVNYRQTSLSFELDAKAIAWDEIPELDVSPEASMSLNNVGNQNILWLEHKEKEIQLAKEENSLNEQKSSHSMNIFLKKYAANLLKYSIIAIIVLYLIDTLITIFNAKNSSFSDPLFTLLQTIITTVIGYLIGSNQNKE